MARYSTEPKTKKYVKGYGYLSFARNLSNKYGKRLLDTATKTGLDSAKTAFKSLVHEAAEATAELIGHKIAEKLVKPKYAPEANSRNVKEIVIPPQKRQGILYIYMNIIYVIYYYKMEHHKISKLLNDSSVLEFVTKKWIELNNLSSGNYSANSIRFKTSVLRSDLCIYSDAYVVLKGTIDFLASAANEYDIQK